jgi:pimeloyl-ACP methyl ester carboxylesterase
MLQYLAQRAGRLVTKDELTQAVWSGRVVTDDSLVQCVKLIRHALGDEGRRILQTEPRRGYRLIVAGDRSAAETPATPARFEQDIRFAVSSGGVRIAYATSGRGPPLVRAAHWMTHLEHDWCSLANGEWIQGLSQRYRLLRYDGRGWGLSDRGFATWSLDEQVADLEAVVDAAGFDRFALWGRSGGGRIAIRYAARHPERVSHLIFEGAYARGPLRRGANSRSPETLAALRQLIEDGWGRDNPAARQFITSYLFPGASIEQQRSFNQLQRIACTPQEAAQFWDEGLEVDVSPELASIRCPTLVLHSPHDAAVPYEEGRLLAAGIAGARFEPFESVNHHALPDEPAFEVENRLFDEFLLGSARRRPVLRAVAGGRHHADRERATR